VRADLEQKRGEDYLDWITRLHTKVQEANSILEVDLEIITILINNIPQLVREAKEKN